MKNDFAILVNTCDAYHDVLDVFFPAFLESTDFGSIPIYLNSENLVYSQCEKYNVISFTITPIEKDAELWGARLKGALNKIQEDFVLSTYDDYFINQKMNSTLFEAALELLRGNSNLACVYLYPIIQSGLYPCDKWFGLVDVDVPFRINSAPALWNRKTLLSLIDDTDTPWAWEAFAGFRSAAKACEVVAPLPNSPIIYSYAQKKGGGVYRGKWVDAVVVPMIRRYNLDIDLTARGFVTETELVPRSLAWKMQFFYTGYKMVGIKALILFLLLLKEKIAKIVYRTKKS
jgi:hypothetical protein